jgi:hypothetical protein
MADCAPYVQRADFFMPDRRSCEAHACLSATVVINAGDDDSYKHPARATAETGLDPTVVSPGAISIKPRRKRLSQDMSQ